MTAEVALMNNKAVVLAADSATTIGTTGKIYNADKLFPLRDDEAIGIMVYNNAEFAGIPWETFIKTYARDDSRDTQPTVDAYVDDFLNHVRTLVEEGHPNPDDGDGSPSGIIVAGFGDNELRPTLDEVLVKQKDGELVHKIVESTDFEAYNLRSAVLPFAQSEMVPLFFNGVDPDLLDAVQRDFKSQLKLLAQDLSKKFHEDYNDRTGRLVNKHARNLKKRIESRIETDYRSPIIRMIQSLPKVELANLAESMVSMVALKRRVAPELETVGGPVDVAVISKGDGFVWHKRKRDLGHSDQPRLPVTN